MPSRNMNESQKALRKCKNQCVICGWSNKSILGTDLVEGCHIYDFSKENKFDVFDNIIALCPNHHTEFDHYCLYIDTKSHSLVFFDENNEFSNKNIEIEYVNNEYLAHRQYLTLKKWSDLSCNK